MFIYLLCLLHFCPPLKKPSLVNLVSRSSLQPTTLMPGLVQTPDCHRTTYNRTTELKLATQSSLQVAGLQESAITPGLLHQAIGLMCRVLSNGLEDRGSIPGWVIPKTQKMVLDEALVNTQHYKVRIKGTVEQSREWSNILPYTSV